MAAGSSGARKSDDTHTKTERFTAMKRSVFIFYSCSKKAGACTAATRSPFSNLHADSTSLFSYHKNTGRTAEFSTRCARYRPRRMPSNLSTSKYSMIADTSAAVRAVTVLSNRQANVCAKKRVHRKTAAPQSSGTPNRRKGFRRNAVRRCRMARLTAAALAPVKNMASR